jgi:hypothetical protein
MIKINFGTAAAVALLGATAFSAPADAQSRRALTAPSDAMMAPPTQSLGGPVRHGNYCWVSTDQRGFGYWRSCTVGYESFASAAQPPLQTPQPIPAIDAYAAAREDASNMLGGGGGSGGDGGSGSGGGSGGEGGL